MRIKHSFKINGYIDNPVAKIIIVPLLIGVISSIVATLIVNNSIRASDEKRIERQRIENLNNLTVGTSQNWVNEKFGEPQYVGIVNDFLLCAYTTEDYMLQVAYDGDDSLVGYLITIMNEKFKFVPTSPRFFIGFNKAIGEFSYSDFSRDAAYNSDYNEAFGFIAANGRRMYYEEYTGGAPGGYYNYYITYVDYGARFPCDLTHYVSEDGNFKGSAIITNRETCYPNSIGIASGASLEFDMKKTLLTIGWFDSLNIIYKKIQ